MNSNPAILSAQTTSKPAIGYIVGGSLKDNLRVRLTVAASAIQEGAFLVIEDGNWLFYGLVTDLGLGATDPRFADEQSEQRLPAELAKLLHGQTLFTNLEVLPVLMVDRGPEPGSPGYTAWMEEHPNGTLPQPIKTIPAHHAGVRMAEAGDVVDIFGDPKKRENFTIGFTREQNLPVCIELKKFIQRSTGIFGATGTGKSFLTRVILSGLIHNKVASVLVLDMHNEYAFDDTSSDTNERVPGLKTKMANRVSVVGLGRGSRIRTNIPDFDLEIDVSDIRPEDIELLTQELNLRETTATTLDALMHCFKAEHWFQEFRKLRPGALIENEEGKKIPAPDSVEGWAIENGVNPSAASGLYSKMNRLFNKPYIVEKPASDGIGEIIKTLEAGKSVVLSFGEFESDLDYLFVSNLLTRRIRNTWEEKTNAQRSKGGMDVQPLIIVLEEAHKLLNREMASQTTFSTIAREMRKYHVTLLIIDQRPSQIYDEVMSQLGTRISGFIGDEDDIHAVLSGQAGRDTLRGMLSHLQQKEEIMVLGWGVPMPIVLKSRRYDDAFWKELKKSEPTPEKDLKELGF